MATPLSRSSTLRSLPTSEKAPSPPRMAVARGSAARAIAVFLDNELWFASLSDWLLSFLTPERCSAVLGDADYALVFGPFAGLHATVTAITGLAPAASDIGVFVSTLASNAALITVSVHRHMGGGVNFLCISTHRCALAG